MQGDWPWWADWTTGVVLLGLVIIAGLIFAKKSK